MVGMQGAVNRLDERRVSIQPHHGEEKLAMVDVDRVTHSSYAVGAQAAYRGCNEISNGVVGFVVVAGEVRVVGLCTNELSHWDVDVCF